MMNAKEPGDAFMADVYSFGVTIWSSNPKFSTLNTKNET